MTEPIRAGHNGIDGDKLSAVVKEAERIEAEIASAKGAHMKFCQKKREEIAGVIKDAKAEHGIPTKELKAVLKRRKARQKMEELRDRLEADQQDTLDQMEHALGDLADLPLGAAAMDRARGEAPSFHEPDFMTPAA